MTGGANTETGRGPDPHPLLGVLGALAHLEVGRVGVAVSDASGRYVAANDAACGLFGRAEDEIVGHSFIEFTHPDDAPVTVDATIEAISAGRSSYTVERRILRPDGEAIWVRVGVGVLRDGETLVGAITLLEGTDEPATAFRHADRLADAHRSDPVLTAVAGDAATDAVPVPLGFGAELVWLVDAFGSIRHVFPGGDGLLPDRSSLIGTPATDAVHPEDRELFRDALARAADGADGTTEQLEVRLPGASGWRRSECRITSQLANTDVAALVLNSIDITGRFEAAAEVASGVNRLTRSERRFRLVFENAPVGIALIDLDGRYLRVNRAFAEIAGRDPDDVVGLSVFDIGDVRHHAETRQFLDQVRAGDADALSGEREIVRPDGQRRWVSVQAVLEQGGDEASGYLVAMVEDITDRRNHAIELELQALRDPLTELPNRACLRDRIEQQLVSASRTGLPVTVLFCDLDGLKAVNDQFGHAVADDLLVGVGGRIVGAVRAADTVGRWAGDEFVVCSPQSTTAEATAVGERILEAMQPPFQTAAGPLRIGLSIGVAQSSAQSTVDSLLGDADEAMYEAKRRGRGQVVVFDEVLARRRGRRLRLQNELRRALDAGEFAVFYQPQFDLRTGQCVGAEAMLRWEHPDRGVVPAGEFMTNAAASGLVPDLSAFALEEACRQGVRWGAGRPGAAVPAVAVNLGHEPLHYPGTLAMVAEALTASGLDARSLRLEVTEDALIHDIPVVRAILQELTALGVRVGVDDFGSGFASMAHLYELPLAFLKLDGGLVEAPQGHVHEGLVRDVVALARSLGMQVFVERVEDDRTVGTFRDLGVDIGQGFRWAPALPADELDVWLAGHRPEISVPSD